MGALHLLPDIHDRLLRYHSHHPEGYYFNISEKNLFPNLIVYLRKFHWQRRCFTDNQNYFEFRNVRHSGTGKFRAICRNRLGQVDHRDLRPGHHLWQIQGVD